MSPVILFVIAVLAGLAAFLVILKFIPILERKNSLSQKHEVLREATAQRKKVLESAAQQQEENLSLLREDLDSLLAQRREDLQVEEAELDGRTESLTGDTARVQKVVDAAEARKERLGKLEEQTSEVQEAYSAARAKVISALEERSGERAEQIESRMTQEITEARQLETQKVLKLLTEELSSSARKKAQQVLEGVHARYSPDFVWPKPSNLVDIVQPAVFERYADEENEIIRGLREISGASIHLLPHDRGAYAGQIKVVGGFGLNREAARKTLEETVGKSSPVWSQAEELYLAHKSKLEAEAVQLGNKAVNILRLDGIHLEIQKLVGALNWRTSYRQNQWYHTLEVAILAGILASELGVDPDEAKRVGMLHDIGKAIDYRIEGSHAVISGDYADRCGESKVVCDAVMSHHGDLLVETPLAYVLRAADTLSGARPGARVNLEEGYQIRLSAIAELANSFGGVVDVAIMNGGREVHVQVNESSVSEDRAREISHDLAKRITEEVAFPGQIKVMVTRAFESVSVA